jgi:hypothetical protein
LSRDYFQVSASCWLALNYTLQCSEVRLEGGHLRFEGFVLLFDVRSSIVCQLSSLVPRGELISDSGNLRFQPANLALSSPPSKPTTRLPRL